MNIINISAPPKLNTDRLNSRLTIHLLAIAHFIQKYTLEQLTEVYGYKSLRLSFEAFIALIGEGGIRQSELASRLAMTKQSCNKVINQLENYGYVDRNPDTFDGRAKQLVLTASGQQLLKNGSQVTEEIQRKFSAIVGHQLIINTIDHLNKLCEKSGINIPAYQQTPHTFAEMGIIMPRLSDYIIQQLLELISAKGFAGLKPSFGQVIGLIRNKGRSIQNIATHVGVSKQAISAITTELKNLGYIHRDTDPNDRRQVILRLTTLGNELLLESVNCILCLEDRFHLILGNNDFSSLQNCMRDLCDALELDVEQYSDQADHTISDMAKNLLDQIGPANAEALANQLLNLIK